MNIEILFFGKLRELAGTPREEATLETGAKLSDLLLRLSKKHGGAFTQQLKDTEGLRILVYGREYQVLVGVTTILRDRDTVVLLPLIEGG